MVSLSVLFGLVIRVCISLVSTTTEAFIRTFVSDEKTYGLPAYCSTQRSIHTHTGVAAHSVAVTAYRLHDRTTTTPCGPEEIIHLRTDGTNRSNDNQTQHTNSVYAERAATISSISLVAAL